MKSYGCMSSLIDLFIIMSVKYAVRLNVLQWFYVLVYFHYISTPIDFNAAPSKKGKSPPNFFVYKKKIFFTFHMPHTTHNACLR